eukprot:TRINITY_DN9454_c0_g1_i2.p1 TRINITY_DN9454_c0_g1~~TRINITY_DN9454_c0_g1_i2.p1  ORF type:complete len:170 (+),score=15.19 TRINITY_DN9454_c0_g1_i2:262-771(+)
MSFSRSILASLSEFSLEGTTSDPQLHESYMQEDSVLLLLLEKGTIEKYLDKKTLVTLTTVNKQISMKIKPYVEDTCTFVWKVPLNRLQLLMQNEQLLLQVLKLQPTTQLQQLGSLLHILQLQQLQQKQIQLLQQLVLLQRTQEMIYKPQRVRIQPQLEDFKISLRKIQI